MEHLCHKYVLLFINTSQSFPHLWLITGLVTIVTRQVPLMEQELLTLPEHLSSSPFITRVRVTWSLVLCVCFVDHCLSFFFWLLCCLFFLDWRILITSLVSSNSSYVNFVLFLSMVYCFNVLVIIVPIALFAHGLIFFSIIKTLNNRYMLKYDILPVNKKSLTLPKG